MTDAPTIEIETVAEVLAVERETLAIMRFDDEQLIGLGWSGRYGGEYQQLTFPMAKAGAVAAAIIELARGKQ